VSRLRPSRNEMIANAKAKRRRHVASPYDNLAHPVVENLTPEQLQRREVRAKQREAEQNQQRP
jgi:hypothetical protein